MTKRNAMHCYTILAATVAGFLSGQALAESAGHVSFVYGPVTAVTHDGQTRTLHRGDEVDGGDRISTSSGRVQIRFTDGGFVALQPNTIFGVDQYIYANKKPEDTSVFFNLVRGGMRTITGVIGHINKDSYRVKTPVATIGIRGTSFTADINGDSLDVTVNLGSVIVTNDQGNITLIAGQSAVVQPNTAPQQTNNETNVGAPGPGSGGSSSSSSSSTQPTAGNQQQTGGLPNGVEQPSGTQTAGPLQSTNFGLPLYSVAIPGQTPPVTHISGIVSASSNVAPIAVDALANFDSSGDLVLADVNGGPIFNNTGTAAGATGIGALQYANVVNEGGISFGELTGGQSLDGSVTAAVGQYIPYIVGQSGPAPAPIGLVSYSLAGAGDASTPRLYSGGSTSSGTLNTFNINIDLTNALLNLRLDLTMNGTDYLVVANNQSVPTVIQDGGFQLTGLTGVTSTACDGNCSATVSGFFAGNDGSRLGASYDLSTGSGDILGVAALTQSGPVAISSTAPLGSSVDGSPSYTFAVPVGGSSNSSVLNGQLQASFDGTEDSAPGALRTLSDSNGKQIFANPASSSTALQYNGLVTLGDISYSEVTDGSGTLSIAGVSSGSSSNNSNTLTVGPGLYVPYILGVTGTAPDLEIVHYSLQGGTAPREDLSTAGVLNHFNLDLDLNSLELSADLEVTIGSASYSVVANNQQVPNLLQSGTFSLGGLAATGNNCVSQTCTATINGFIAGSSSTASQVGATYAINVGLLDSIGGVAALGQTSVPTALVYQTNSYGSDAYAAIDTYSDSNGLLDAGNGSEAILNRNDSSGTQVASDTTGGGSDGTLEWGRWVAGMPSVEGESTPVLTNVDSVHYITGAPTPAAVMSALNAQQGAAVKYSLEGGTSPTNGSAVGTLGSGSFVQVSFGPSPTMLVDLQVGIAGLSYVVNDTKPLSTNSATFSLSSLATTGCASTCSTNVNGFFAGAQANKVGLGYAITDNTTLTQGVAAFGR